MYFRQYPLIMHKLGVFLAWLSLLLLSNAALGATFDAQIDRSNIGEDETLNLVFTYSGEQISSDPDFTPLMRNFDILSNSKSMQHSITNGSVRSTTEWRLLLAPKQVGQLLIPPISIKGVSSRPLRVEVNKASQQQNSQLNGQIVAIEAEIDKDSVYVQEQVILTYRLFYKERISYDPGGDFQFANAQTEELPKAEYSKMINGERYNVIEFKFALFPEASGELSIPSRLWQFQTNPQSMSPFGFGGGRTQVFRKKTPAFQVTVKARPSSFPAHQNWLPAEALLMREQWSQSPDNFIVGEPITRTITVQARGQSGELLPVVYEPSSNAEFKYYPDKPKMETQPTAEGIVGLRQENIAVVPNREGQLTLPAVELHWWNTNTDKLEVARIPERTITVQAAVTTAINDSEVSSVVLPESSSSVQTVTVTPIYWPILLGISLLFNLLLAATVLLMGGRPKQQQPKNTNTMAPKLAEVAKLIDKSCRNKDAAGLHSGLLHLAKILFPNRIARPDAVAQLLNDSKFDHCLVALDAHIYAGKQSDIDFDYIQKRCQSLIKRHSQTQQVSNELTELYAN